MRKNKKWTAEDKLKVVLSYINGEGSQSMIAERFKCNQRMLQRWIATYRKHGIEGLRYRKTKIAYTDEFKRRLIMEVLSGHSQGEVWRKYDLPPHSTTLLSTWIKAYTSGNKTTSKGRNRVNKGRKTTYEERITITEFALNHDKDYQKAAKTFKVSYQQVYSWVRKYELDGKDGLVNRRGKKKKAIEKMSEVERLKESLKIEQRNNRQLQMENDVLKKLNEIEQTLEDYR